MRKKSKRIERTSQARICRKGSSNGTQNKPVWLKQRQRESKLDNKRARFLQATVRI